MKTNGRFKRVFLRILKVAGISAGIILLLFGIVSWVVVEKKNDWLLSQIQSYMNSAQSGQLEITTTNLKLFRSFPDVMIELDGINYYEHRDTLRTPGEQPILHADQLYVAIKLLPLINDELKISEISLSNAQLRISENQQGQFNINLALASPVKPIVAKKIIVTKPTPAVKPPKKKTPSPPAKPKPAIQINLETVSLHDVRITWNAYNDPDTSAIFLKEFDVDLTRDKNIATLDLNSSYSVQSLFIKGSSIPARELKLDARLTFDLDKKELTILQSEIDYDIFTLTLTGIYAHQKNQLLDLQLDASSNDLKLLSRVIKQKVFQQNPNLLKRGDIYINGRVFGELKHGPPQFDIRFGVKDLTLNLPKRLGTFQDIGFDGKFSSGKLADYSQAAFEIRNLRGQLPSGFLKGDFTVHNFADPVLQYNLHTKLKLDGYDQIFEINSLRDLKGTISLQAEFSGPLKYFGEHRMDSSRSSMITFDNVSFVLAKTNQKISGLSGKIENRDNQASIENLHITYGENDLQLNATVDNLMHFLFKRERDILATGSIRSTSLLTKDFLFDTTSIAHIQDKIKNLSLDFQFNTVSKKNTEGKTVIADLDFDIKRLSAQLEKLPDLNMITAKGMFSKTDQGLKLDLREFHATMPSGKLDVTGDLLIPKRRLWQFNAKVKVNKFPWTYVKELIAEIKSSAEPTAKNLPVKEMDIVTGDLDVSAAIITYPFDFTNLDVRNSRISFTSPNHKTLSVDKLNADLKNLYFIHPENSGALIGLKSTTGTIQFKQLNIPGLKKIDINMKVAGKNDSINIDFSSATQVAKSEKGKFFMDMSGKDFNYQLTYTVLDADLKSFIQKFYKKKFMEGEIDYTLDLKTSGSSMDEVKQNLAGTIEITGDSLELYGIDIDKALRKFEKSQNFNLTDVGAVIIAGPLGLAVTKGSDFVSLATINLNPKHHTDINKLMARWKLENKQLSTEDVAFTTLANRIAFDGKIDFARDSIPGLTIAVIDKNGCSLMDQKLYGKTNDLKTGKLNITKTLFGSVINFVNAIVGKDCKPVYAGKVQAP